MALVETSIEIPLGTLAGLRSAESGGVPVLALHGWLDNAASFIPLSEHLPGIDLVAIDLPGHGRSVHLPPAMHYTFEMAVHQVLDVADVLGWEKFCLLGHSMGAAIASLVSAVAPERVARLVCIEALGGLAHPVRETALRMRESVNTSRALRSKPLRVFAEKRQAIDARMRVNQMSEPVARLIVDRGMRQVDGGWVWSSDPRMTVPTFMRPMDGQIEDIIAAIACPVQVIFADPAQPYLPDATRQRYAASLADGQLSILPGTHHLHMEAPVPVARRIVDFLGDFRV